MNRRAVLTRIVQGFTVVGAGFLSYPFLKAFLPSAATNDDVEVDISDLSPGEWKSVTWQGRHVTVVKRGINFVPDGSVALKDPSSTASTQPAFAQKPGRSRRDDVFVAFSNCTHLGCEVRVRFDEPDLGFECPCHQSRFDQAGRVYDDAVALYNLEVPEYKFLSRNVIKFLRD